MPIRVSDVRLAYAAQRNLDGFGFNAALKTPLASLIADDDPFDVLLVIGNRKFTGVGTWTSLGDFELFFYKNPTTSDLGTLVEPVSRNQIAGQVATTLFYRSPTVTTTGIQLAETWVFGGAGGIASASLGGFVDEWILTPNTTYLLRLINRSGQARHMQQTYNFYED
jgi:hypothetical protein